MSITRKEELWNLAEIREQAFEYLQESGAPRRRIQKADGSLAKVYYQLAELTDQEGNQQVCLRRVE